MDQDEPPRDEQVMVLIGSPAQVAATLQELRLGNGSATVTLRLTTEETADRPADAPARAVPSDVGEISGTAKDAAPGLAPSLLRNLPRTPNDFDRAVALLRSRHRLLHTQCLVLALRFRGFENEETANALGVEIATVKFHIGNALRRMGVEPRTRVPRIFADTVAALEEVDHALPCDHDLDWLTPLQTALRHLRCGTGGTRALARGLDSGRASPTAGSKSKGTP